MRADRRRCTLCGMTDIPALRPPHESPTIDTVYELTQRWRALMGSLGFSHHRLWLLLLDPDGRVVPHVLQIDDIPPGAEAADCVPLLEMAGHIVPEAGSLAILQPSGQQSDHHRRPELGPRPHRGGRWTGDPPVAGALRERRRVTSVRPRRPHRVSRQRAAMSPSRAGPSESRGPPPIRSCKSAFGAGAATSSPRSCSGSRRRAMGHRFLVAEAVRHWLFDTDLSGFGAEFR